MRFKFSLAVFLIGLCGWRSSPCWSDQKTSLQSIAPNNQAIQELEKENFYLAFQNLARALETDSLSPILHFNLAYIYSLNKETDKAIAEYDVVKKFTEHDPDLQFKAFFNQAAEYLKNKNIAEALNCYQSALEIFPESKEVKTNIELLWQGQGQGEGDGQSKDQKDQNDKKGDQGQGDTKDDPKKDQGQNDKQDDSQKKQQKPKPFESQELSKETVSQILDELKSQEQRVRSEDYSKGAKEKPRDKQW